MRCVAIDRRGKETMTEPMMEAPRTESPEDKTTNQLVSMWQELLGLESISPDQNYFDLGGDSSLAVRMFSQIEKEFGVKLPLAILFEAPTIAELAQVLSRESSSRWSALVAIQPAGSRLPFFCMHGAGGNVLNYRDLSKHLGLDQPFYGLQSLGLDGSCPAHTRVEDMAAEYIKEMRSVQPHGPYLVGGYCGGGTIAFEVAQQLQASGEPVALLALFDTMNWSQIPISTWNKISYGYQRLIFHTASFLSLDLDDKIQFFREKREVLRNRMPVWRGMLSAKFGNNSTSAKSQARLLGEIWRTNDLACWTYIPKPYPGRVTDFRPTKQYRIFSKPNLKWDALAQQGQEIVVLPVYPASMLLEPFVKRLAEALKASIDGAVRV